MYAKANNNSSNNNNKDGVVQGINQSVNILLWRKLRCNSHDTNTRIKFRESVKLCRQLKLWELSEAAKT